MTKLRSLTYPVLNALALVVAVAAVTLWSAKLEHRVAGLENAVQALAAVPASAARPALSAQEACAALALRIAEALQKPDVTGADTLRGLMHDAGCPPTTGTK